MCTVLIRLLSEEGVGFVCFAPDDRQLFMHEPLVEHIGFRNTVHGGIIATVLDEVMGWVCAVQTRKFAFCAELTIRFLQPLQPGEPAIAIGHLAGNRRNRVFETAGEIQNGRQSILATARGKYLPLSDQQMNEMNDELVKGLEYFQPFG